MLVQLTMYPQLMNIHSGLIFFTAASMGSTAAASRMMGGDLVQRAALPLPLSLPSEKGTQEETRRDKRRNAPPFVLSGHHWPSRLSSFLPLSFLLLNQSGPVVNGIFFWIIWG